MQEPVIALNSRIRRLIKRFACYSPFSKGLGLKKPATSNTPNSRLWSLINLATCCSPFSSSPGLNHHITKSPYHQILLLLPLSLSFSLCLSQPTLPPFLETFTPKDYSAHSQIFCSAFDTSTHRLFLGTAHKILVYDGVGFGHIPTGPGKNVMSLAMGTGDTLWAGCSSDLGYVCPDSAGTLVFHSLLALIPYSLRDFNIIGSTHFMDNMVVFNGLKYMFIYDIRTGSFRIVMPEKKFYFSHNLGGEICVMEMGMGIWKLGPQNKGDKTLISGSEVFSDKPIMSILPGTGENAGKHLVFTDRNGVFIYDPGNKKSPPEDKTPENLSNGDSRLRWNDATEPYFVPLLNGKDTALAEIGRKYRVYWAQKIPGGYAVGTLKNGLYLFDEGMRETLHLDRTYGLPDNMIWNLSYHSGTLCAGTNNGFILIHIPSTINSMKEGPTYNGSIQSLLLSGNTLFAATSQGLYRWDSAFSLIPGIEGQVYSIKELSDHTLVVAGADGLFHYSPKNGTLRRVSMYHANALDVITAIPDGEGKGEDIIGMGGRQGIVVYRYDKGEFTQWAQYAEIPEEVISIGLAWIAQGFHETGKKPKGQGEERERGNSIRILGGLRSNGYLEAMYAHGKPGGLHHRDTAWAGIPGGSTKVFHCPTNPAIRKGRLRSSGDRKGNLSFTRRGKRQTRSFFGLWAVI